MAYISRSVAKFASTFLSVSQYILSVSQHVLSVFPYVLSGSQRQLYGRCKWRVFQLSTNVVPRTKPIRASESCVLTRLILLETSIVSWDLQWRPPETALNLSNITSILPECLHKCEINAESVRLLYWPIENSTISSQNRSLALASSSQYTTVADGFTLYVCLFRQATVS